MVKYLIVLLDDTCTSFCHYKSINGKRNLISLDVLKKAVHFAMKENLLIQYIYPDYELPESYNDVIDDMNHVNIVPACSDLPAEAVVIDGFNDFNRISFSLHSGVSYILRTELKSFMTQWEILIPKLEQITRLNIVYTDVCEFNDQDSSKYAEVLSQLAEHLTELAMKGYYPQVNILTDRILLSKMNNCNAGVENVTLAPDGQFYVCPGFYYDKLGSIGSLSEGLKISNSQLYKIEYAPICRICDSYHCKRCIWLNKRTTLEVNTPSHEQCVISHVERNASREYMLSFEGRKRTNDIPEIDYLDPFDELIKRK